MTRVIVANGEIKVYDLNALMEWVEIQPIGGSASSPLADCPFCGSGAVDLERDEAGMMAENVWGHCNFCNADGPRCESEEEAIEAWNHRANDDPLADWEK